MSEAVSSGLAKAGDFSVDLNNVSYGKEITIIPLLITESASLLFNKNKPPRNLPQELINLQFKDGSILCSTKNMVTSNKGYTCERCPFGEYFDDWGVEGEKQSPSCKKSIDVICVIDGEMEPVVLSLRKTSYKAGRILLNAARRDPLGVAFGTKYKLKSEPSQFENYKFHTISETIEKTPLKMDEVNKLIPLAEMILTAQSKNQMKQEHEEGGFEDLPV
jgi:hypothetical protein